ncbi:MAG TPA: adenylosuccinate synthetase [Ktedonobacterales bacterium]|jgi:adenylosuccinate synthase
MSTPERQALLIADLGYGDAGKGGIVDYLTRLHHAHTVVRYNGGAQAAHNVVESSGRHHTFAQFGSGTFHPGTRTHLSRFMLVNPLSMLKEAQHLESIGIADAFQRTSIDAAALIITPFQQSANRLQEIARASGRHGSCGMGIGETMSDYLRWGEQMLFAGDLLTRATIRNKLRFIRQAKRPLLEEIHHALPHTEEVIRELRTFSDLEIVEDCTDLFHYFAQQAKIVDERYLGKLLEEPGTVIFEGAQGVLLDEWYGFHPYTTWSTTTFANADQLLKEQDYVGNSTRIGVLRAYATRHGAGPFVAEDAMLTAALPDAHNSNNPWQQTFRVGYFDLVATQYALQVAGHVDCLAVTNLDRLAALPDWKVCAAYQYQGDSADDLARYFEVEGRTIKRIKMRQPPNLAHQERLTTLLSGCAPLYQSFIPAHAGVSAHEDTARYLALLEQHLKVPVAIASSGPTTSDKALLQAGAIHAPL